MKKKESFVSYTKEEASYWEHEIKHNRKFFLFMYILIILVECFMSLVLFVTNSFLDGFLYNPGYFWFYFIGIVNAVLSITMIYFIKRYRSHIQMFCLLTLMIWACLFTVYDIYMGSSGYILPQVLILSATTIRFPKIIHFRIHVLTFSIYSLLLLATSIDHVLLASHLVNTGLLFLFASIIILYSNTIRIRNYHSALKMKHQKEQLLHMMRYDTLCEIYTRATILTMFEQAVKKNTAVGCIMCDIDDFKKYNDMFGHRTGDNVLRQTATLLKEVISLYNGKAGRYGGEEFLILIEHCSMEKLEAVLKDIHHAFDTACHNQSVTLSLGGTLFIEGDTIDRMIFRGDQAMYRAKHAGKHTYHIL